MTLQELVERFIELDEQEDALCADQESVRAALKEIDEQLSDKFDGYIKLLRKYESREAALDEEIKRLQARKKEAGDNAKAIKTAILSAMRATGKRKLENDLYTVTVRKCAPTLVVDVESDVPEEYQKISVSVDKTKLKKYLTAIGTDTEYAHLEGGYSLSVK